MADPRMPGCLVTMNFCLMDIFRFEYVESAIAGVQKAQAFAGPMKPQRQAGVFLHRIRADSGVLPGRWMCGVPKVVLR